MTTSALNASDALLPQPSDGFGAGAALALLAHALLLAALALGVQWHASAPEVVSAELWAAVPQVAAPRIEESVPQAPPTVAPLPKPALPQPDPMAPPPVAAEPDAQIALERTRREKRAQEQRAHEEAARAKALLAERKAQEEREKRELRERREKADREAREKQLREQKLADARAAQDLERRRQENLRRMLAQAGSGPATSSGSAAVAAGPSRSYAGRIAAAIKPNIVFTGSVSGNPAAEVEVRATPDGTILRPRLVTSSGNKEWDEAVLRAIERTDRLPRDVDGRVPATIIIAFRPQESR